jgi:DNA polymerase gamma 1
LEPPTASEPAAEVVRDYMTASASARQAEWWPQWYHELFAPNVNRPWDMMNFSVRNMVATLLLQLSWRGYPLFKSRQYGWVFRMPAAEAEIEDEDRSRRLLFSAGQQAFIEREEEAELEAETVAKGEKRPAGGAAKKLNPDIALYEASIAGDFVFFQVPHPNGEGNNVGYVTSKPFIKFIEDETLTSVYPLAKEAMQMNVACSYWISVRERVVEQLAIRQSAAMPMGFPTSTPAEMVTAPPAGSSLATGPADNDEGYGVILPQVIVMGTITRRAIEKTWLTASNAKKNRVGSELKAMIQAPEGFNIVGADVDSEELWIASLLGDAQLGMHGASAIGWMTLEGTKAEGTDVHSKTASIVNITRDMAKVFNYSRIYGAGVANATRLLLDGMKEPDVEHAEAAARRLYLSTKGDRVPRKSREFHAFWFGGSESYLFNSIEQVARSRRPTTPALGCGVTAALREEFLTNKEDHMTSRINWVVQSSGVDYLHLLIVAVNRLCKLYAIEARYLLSVHDEVRYLCREEDRYRLALALQIANLWTRSLFARKLGMEDLPQGCAFFSEVDVDKVLRKEVSMPCVTPSNPEPIAPGEALSIGQVLDKTGASLFRDGRPSSNVVHPPLPSAPSSAASSSGLFPPRPYQDRASAIAAAASATTSSLGGTSHIRADPTQHERWRRFFLQAQALKTEGDIQAAWEHYGRPPDPVRAYRQRNAGPDANAGNPWARRAGKSFDTGKTKKTAGAKAKQPAPAAGAAGGPPPMMRRS